MRSICRKDVFPNRLFTHEERIAQLMQDQPFEALVAKVHDTIIRPADKARWIHMGRQLDVLGRIDVHTQAIFIDEATLHSLLSESLPEAVVVRFVGRLRTHLGAKLLPAGKVAPATLKPLSFSALLEKTGLRHPSSDPPFDVSKPTSMQEMRDALKQRYPALSNDWFTTNIIYQQAKDAIVESANTADESFTSASTVGDVLNCVLRRLGFWAFLDLVGILLIFGIVSSASAGTLTAPAIAFAIFLWAGDAILTIATINACISNPQS